jgi:hypothetical protein
MGGERTASVDGAPSKSLASWFHSRRFTENLETLVPEQQIGYTIDGDFWRLDLLTERAFSSAFFGFFEWTEEETGRLLTDITWQDVWAVPDLAQACAAAYEANHG